jgi:hypothetical protein
MNHKEHIAAIRSFIDEEHFRYRRFGDGVAGDGEVQVTSKWGLVLEATPSPLLACLAADFKKFAHRCMGLTFDGSQTNLPSVRLRCTADRPGGLDFDRQSPSVESFSIDVGDSQVVIEAGHERGLLQGTHYLERMMADRGASILPRGRIDRTPLFTPRLTNSIFVESDQNVTDPSQFSDEYVGLMSHFGANGIHMFADLWDFCRSDILPELNAADFNDNIAGLNRLCARANARGIDLYLCVVLKLLDADHAVFHAHPDTRGAAADIFGLPGERHCLCSGSETVLSFYEQSLANLFDAAPDVAGMICLVGGEGFFHCFTRPRGTFAGRSTCPRCRDRDPSEDVAALVNRAAGAVKRTGQHKSFYAWPYSAFVWSGTGDRAQGPWMDRLSDDVSVIANFATGSPDRVNDDGVFLFDYNIKSIGASEVFAAQHQTLKQRDRPIYAKVETNTTPLFFGMPYIPVHHRWHRRWKAMAQEPVAGFIGQWRFYGMNGSPPEEIQYHATWNPGMTASDVLTNIARRDHAVSQADAERLALGWEQLSDAWDDIPYSAMLCGERAFYMRGPMYLGPAHPLIFNPQEDYGLSTKFRTLRGDLDEGISPQEREQLVHSAPPRYVDQLMFVMPYGEQRFLELISRCRSRWEEGLKTLRASLESSDAPRARMELDVCEMTGIHIATVEHTARFYFVRDRLWREPQDRAGFVEAMAELHAITKDEIANARRSLPMLERDPRLAFNFCYRNPYDAGMVREKIAQCQHLIETELPQFDRGTRFHLWMEFP